MSDKPFLPAFSIDSIDKALVNLEEAAAEGEEIDPVYRMFSSLWRFLCPGCQRELANKMSENAEEEVIAGIKLTDLFAVRGRRPPGEPDSGEGDMGGAGH